MNSQFNSQNFNPFNAPPPLPTNFNNPLNSNFNNNAGQFNQQTIYPATQQQPFNYQNPYSMQYYQQYYQKYYQQQYQQQNAMFNYPTAGGYMPYFPPNLQQMQPASLPSTNLTQQQPNYQQLPHNFLNSTTADFQQHLNKTIPPIQPSNLNNNFKQPESSEKSQLIKNIVVPTPPPPPPPPPPIQSSSIPTPTTSISSDKFSPANFSLDQNSSYLELFKPKKQPIKSGSQNSKRQLDNSLHELDDNQFFDNKLNRSNQLTNFQNLANQEQNNQRQQNLSTDLSNDLKNNNLICSNLMNSNLIGPNLVDTTKPPPPISVLPPISNLSNINFSNNMNLPNINSTNKSLSSTNLSITNLNNTNQSTEINSNNNNSHYLNTINPQPIKKPKIDINNLDQNKIKSQLEQINQLKQLDQFNKFNQPNLMNQSQTLLTHEDEYWLRLLNPEQKKLIDNIKEQQKNFEDIYRNWEDEYKEWKSKNLGILDIETYQNNSREWEDWKTNLLNRKIKLNAMCQEKIDELKKQILNDNNLNQQISDNNVNFDQINPINKEINSFDSPIIQNTNNLINNNLEDNNTQIIEEKHEQQIKDIQVIENNKEEEKFDNFDSQNISFGDNPLSKQEDNDSFAEVPVENSFDNFEASSFDNFEASSFDNLNKETPSFVDLNKERASSFDNLNQREISLESQKVEIKENQQSTLFPSSITITKMDEQNKELKNKISKVNIDDVSNFLNYLNETKDALDIIDRLDFKMQQSKLIYNQQLENIKKTIENHSDSENEDVLKDNDFNQFEHTNANQSNDMSLNLEPQMEFAQRGFNLDSVLNKMQQIQNSAEVHHGSLDNKASFNQLNQLESEFSNRNKSIENDFLSKFGLQITVDKVLSYKDKEYFISPPSFTLAAEDLLEMPGRDYRPSLVCVILRGHPNSGKSKLVNLICKAELEYNSKLPNIFSFNDYLEIENRITKIDELSDQYSYRKQLYDNECRSKKLIFEDFKSLIKERKHGFVIYNSINQRLEDFEDFYLIAKLNHYSTYIAEMDFLDYTDLPINSTDFSFDDWANMSRNWELTPSKYLKLKVNNFIKNRLSYQNNITLNREPIFAEQSIRNQEEINDDEEDYSFTNETFFNRVNTNDEFQLAKLDDFRMKLRIPIDVYWALPNNYYQRKHQRKRVRFLDVESKNY